MPTQTTDRNLLFGVLALKADFLGAAQFAEACSAWVGSEDTAEAGEATGPGRVVGRG